MERNLQSEYPYGQFPSKFTKSGQKQYFEQLTNTSQKVENLNFEPNTLRSSNNNSSLQNYNSQHNSSNNAQYGNQNTNQNNNFDFSKLLPLIKMMNDKKSMSSTDMLSMFLPMLGGGNISGLSEIMNLMNKDKATEEKEEDIIISNIKIDDYKRVE